MVFCVAGKGTRVKGKEDELTVITRAKELCQYILVVTDRSPKKFRFTLVSRMQNYALDIIENLYLANTILLKSGTSEEKIWQRQEYQRSAMVTLRLLAYIAMIGRECQCITGKQHSVMADKIMETQRLLYAWAKSDQKRIETG